MGPTCGDGNPEFQPAYWQQKGKFFICIFRNWKMLDGGWWKIISFIEISVNIWSIFEL